MKMLGKMLPLTLILVVASLLGASPPAIAGPPVVSDIWLPIEGTVFHPPQPCMPNGIGEDVSLYGMAHVVSMVDLTTSYVMIFINLADVKGMGVLTDMTYLAVGAVKTGAQLPQGTFTPPDPTAVEIHVAFDLVQAGACPTLRGGAPVFGTLGFNSDGTSNTDLSSLGFGVPTTD